MTTAPTTVQPILIRGARLIDGANKLDAVGDLLLTEGRIAAVGRVQSVPADCLVIEAAGLVASPGFVDIHVHLREPGREDKETIATGTRAAAAGGFTTVCPIPNTQPVIDSQTGLKFILERAKSDAVVRVVPYAAVTKGQLGQEIVEFGDLVANGARGFTDDGRPVMNTEIMRRALEYSSMFGVPILDHCEDAFLAEGGCMHEGIVSLELGLKGIPAIAESIQVARDIELAHATGGHIHIMHVSKHQSVETIRVGKARNARVTAEVTPHHLLLTDEALRGYNTRAKVNPPMGSEIDRQSLIAALLDGTIDCIATDHAPHTDIEKDSTVQEAPFGMVGLETALGVCIEALIKPGFCDLPFLLERLTTRPAAILGLPTPALTAGAIADITLLDPLRTWIVDPAKFHSRSRNSAFAGTQLTGQVTHTIVAGKLIYQDGQILTETTQR
jgi:dihydroorotase